MYKRKLVSGFTTCIAVLTLGFAAACSDDDSDSADDDGGAGMAGAGGASGGRGGASNNAGRSGGPTAGTSPGGMDSGGADGGGAGGAGGSGDETARVRVIHLSPDAPAVDVFVNGDTPAAVSDLEFPKGTPYLEVPAGTYDFDVAASGESPDDAVLSIADLALEAGESYTAVAFDELSSIQALALVDDYSALDPGDIRVRAIHTAAGVGEVDIWNITEPGDPTPLYEDVDFGDAGDAIDVPAGAYTVGIDVDDDAVPDLAFDLPALEGGTAVNLFAVADDGDVFLVAQLPDGTTTRIDPRGPTAYLRVLHLSPDAPAVDVYTDGGDEPIVADLEFPEGTPYLAIPADSYDIDVAPAGTSAEDSVLAVDGLALAADSFYTAVAIDNLADISALALTDDYAGLGEGEIRVRAIHAAPGVGQVDIWNLPASGAPASLWSNVDFGAAGAALDLEAGAYRIGIDVDNDATPDLTFALPDLEAGAFVNVFAVNDEDANVFLIAQLRDGTTARIDPE